MIKHLSPLAKRNSRGIPIAKRWVGALAAFTLVCMPASPCFNAVPQALADEAAPSVATAKSETVHAYADSDGSVTEINVSVSLENGNAAQQLLDTSNLTDIAAVDSNTSFDETEEGILWNAGQKDVSYQGTSTDALPVEMRVSYKLDGKAISSNDIAGKSGHVQVRFDYTNLSRTQVDGKSVYTPFVMVTLLMLDTDTFENVEVTNGKTVEAGERTLVVGYAMPGLQDSLDMSSEDLDIPSYVEFEADVENFELDSTITMATASVLNDMDTDIDTGEIGDAINTMSDAMNQLVNGSQSLTDGLDALSNGAASLAQGTSALSEGTDGFGDSVAALSNGASTVNDGINSYTSGVSGASEIASALAQSLSAYTSSVDQLSTDAADLVTSLTAERDAAAQEASSAAVSVSSAQAAYDAANEAAAAEPTAENVAALDVAAQNLAQAREDAAAAQAKADALAEVVADGSALNSLAGGLSDVAPQGDDLNATAATLQTTLSSLDSAGGNLASGAAQLSWGTQQLADNAPSLESGIDQIDAGATALADGATQATSGSSLLTTALSKFNSEGIQELSNFYEDKVLSITDSLAAIADAGREYDNFSGLTQGTEGHVTFIIETDPIEMR